LIHGTEEQAAYSPTIGMALTESNEIVYEDIDVGS